MSALREHHFELTRDFLESLDEDQLPELLQKLRPSQMIILVEMYRLTTEIVKTEKLGKSEGRDP